MIVSQHTLILASASPARKGLLESIGLMPDEILPADIDETPHKGELPKDYVLRVAEAKAKHIHTQRPQAYIIAADTIGVVGRRILMKEETVEGARKMLQLLSGRRHRVYSGVCVIAPDGKIRRRRVETMVQFKRLEPQELEEYLDSGQWQGKSGCYGIQSRAGGFIAAINGSFSNVVGLPLVETKAMLKGLGW